MRIPNNNIRCCVRNREVFTNNNNTVYSEDRGDMYVVYSYGPHFPMYIYHSKLGVWFANADKYSVTTSRHQSQANPDAWRMVRLDTDAMCKMLDGELDGGAVLLGMARAIGD